MAGQEAAAVQPEGAGGLVGLTSEPSEVSALEPREEEGSSSSSSSPGYSRKTWNDLDGMCKALFLSSSHSICVPNSHNLVYIASQVTQSFHWSPENSGSAKPQGWIMLVKNLSTGRVASSLITHPGIFDSSFFLSLTISYQGVMVLPVQCQLHLFLF